MTPIEIMIPETEKGLFKRAVDYILANTFVVKDRDKAYYNFLANDSNRTSVNTMLGLIGYEVYVNKTMGIAMLRPIDNSDDASMYTTLKLKAHQARLLIVIAKVYYEKFMRGDADITITMRELSEQLDVYNVEGPTGEKNWVNNALNLFRKYSLLNFNVHEEKSEDKTIVLYDSIRLLIGENIETFKANVNSYIEIFKDKTDIDEEEDDDDYDEIHEEE